MSYQIEDTQPEEQLCAKEAYFASLAEWAKQTNQAQEAMLGFPAYLFAKYPQLFHTPNGGQHTDTSSLVQPRPIERPAAPPARAPGIPPGRVRRHRRRILNGNDQQELLERHGGYVLILAPVWKRAVAQAIDMYLLLLLKVLIAHLLVCQFPSIGKELVWLVVTDDVVMYYFGISASTQTTVARIFLKVIGFCYEPLWTSYCNGATPGKWLMEIRILTACAVMPFNAGAEPIGRQAEFVLVYPAWRLSMKRAIFRSLIKRFVTTIILPISIRFVFRRNGAYYDLWTNTIVVEAYSNVLFYPGARGRDQR